MTKSTITRERLEALANAEYCKSNPGAWLLGLKEVNELALMALAAMDSEPVAYIDKQWTLVYYVPPMSVGLKIGDKLYRHAQQPAPVVPPEQHWEELCRQHPDMSIGDAIIRAAWWNHCRAAMLAAAQQSPGSEPATVQGKWIPVSERMPEDEQEVLTINKMGHRFVSFFDKHSGLFFDRLDAPAACCIEHVLVTHWMPLPAGPQEVKGE